LNHFIGKTPWQAEQTWPLRQTKRRAKTFARRLTFSESLCEKIQ